MGSIGIWILRKGEKEKEMKRYGVGDVVTDKEQIFYAEVYYIQKRGFGWERVVVEKPDVYYVEDEEDD